MKKNSVWGRGIAVVIGWAVAGMIGSAVAVAQAAGAPPPPQSASEPLPTQLLVAQATVVAAPVNKEAGPGRIRLPGHVLPNLAYATALPEESAPERLSLTLVLRRDDEAGFQRYLQQVYDPQSPRYRHFLSTQQLTKRFGPSTQSYRSVLRYAQSYDLHVVHESENHQTVTVEGSRSATERAFSVDVRSYRVGQNPFYATDRDPALPRELAGRVMAIDGLSNLGTPQPATSYLKNKCNNRNFGQTSPAAIKKAKDACIKAAEAEVNLYHTLVCSPAGAPALGAGSAAAVKAVTTAAAGSRFAGPIGVGAGLGVGLWCLFYDTIAALNQLSEARTAAGASSGGSRLQTMAAAGRETVTPRAATGRVDGTGQVIGLVEFDAFHTSDVADYLALFGFPATQIQQ